MQHLRPVCHNSWRGTKYYRFNGQSVAMRKNGVLTYLHGDHLGSTVLTTNSSGVFTGQDLRHGYGRQRGGTELGTENRFTGQKLDGAGLMYFNARYYDPELGQFLSPDTLVPDPGNLFDYNRYMFVRGNPMKYTDPSGHCTVLDNGSPDLENDGGCWDAAAEWLATFGLGGHQNEEDWYKYFASNSSMTEELFRNGLSAHWSPIYREAGIYHARYNPPPQMHPVTRDDQAFEQMNDAIGKTICSTWDCVAIGLDVASIGLSIGGDAAIGCAVASAGAAAGVCIPAAVGTKSADIAVTSFSVARTWKMYYDGNASLVDGIVSSTTGSVGFVPGLGEAAGIVQLSYDLADPALSIFIPNRGTK